MSALLGNPMVATAALPLLLGMGLALLARTAVLRQASAEVLPWGAALLFLYGQTLGGPTFPPVAASQKLVYLGLAGILLGLAAPRAGRFIGLLVAVAIAAAFVWLGWRRLTGALDPVVVTAIACALLAVVGALSVVSAPAEDNGAETPTHGPFSVPAAILAMAFAGAIVSVLGASIVVGQFLGAVAALVGGWCLAAYAGLLFSGTSPAGWGRGTKALLAVAVATALLHAALFAPKANPAALVLAAFPLFMPRLVAGPLGFLLPASPRARPLVAGFLIAVPALLALVIALAWAPEGAALGLS